jgi:hypothetical protein
MAALVLAASQVLASRQVRNQAVTVLGGDYGTTISGATKAISGHVYDTNGAPVVGATVDLYRQVDARKVATTTSAVGGTYSFIRDATDPYLYFTVAYSLAGGSTQVHGTSNRGMVPA